MKMFAVIKTNGSDMELLLITDREERAYERLAEAKQKCPSNYAVLHTESFELSSCGASTISANYEWNCLEETVRFQLEDKGVDKERFPDQFEELVSSITCDAYSDMNEYGVSEDFAVDEAMRAHDAEIESIMKDEI